MQIPTNSNRVVFDQSLIDERNFWIERLTPLVETSRLKLDSGVSTGSRAEAAPLTIDLNGEDYQRLVHLTGGKPFLIYTLLMTAMNVCLSKYTDSRQVVIGSPGLKETEGPNVATNALAIASEVGAHLSFRELLVSTRQTLLDAYQRQRYPFELLIQDLKPGSAQDECPLFDVALIFKDIHGEMPETKNGLTITFEQRPDRLTGLISFNKNLFNREDVERFTKHYVNAVSEALKNPNQLISDIRLMSEVERAQIVEEWNRTERDYPRHLCIHQLFEQQAALTPDAIAVVCQGEHLSYRELNGRSNQLAHYLQSLGVGPESLVGICLERSLLMVVSLLATLKAGAAYLPLDPAYPQQRLSFMLEDSALSLLLTQEHLRETLPDSNAATLFCLDSDWHRLAQFPTHNPSSTVISENLAYVIYTSGSTGRPKGVQIEHQSVVALITWALSTFSAQWLSGVLASTSICFDLSVFEFFVPLSAGGAVILVENALQLPELNSSVEVSLINTVPSAMAQLVKSQSVSETVRVVNLGGEAMSRKLAEDVYGLAHIKSVYDLYGPTEDTVYSMWERVEREETGAVLIGRPISNTRVYVADASMQLVPVGVSGQLLLGGQGLARGYLNRPEMTADHFIPDPFSLNAGQRLYRTGDLCRYRPDGRLEYLGRIDQQVKVRGYRIELGEVEAAVSGHRGVKESVVVASEERAGEKRLVCYLVMKEGEVEVSTGELREHLAERLPEYMIPSQFVLMAQLPLTPNGKIDRGALPAPHQSQSRMKRDYVAGRTPVEEKLAKVWADVMGLEKVSIHDNFFELGGDSILSIQVIARANQDGLRLSPKDLFHHQTVAKLAAVAGAAQSIYTEQGIVNGGVELTPIQRWYSEQELEEGHHFNQSLLLEAQQGLDTALLREAAQQLLKHHDALRLRFQEDEAGWHQFHAPADEEVSFSIINLSDLSPEQQTDTIEATATQTQSSLHLSDGPLLRLVYFDLGAERASRLFIVCHHLMIDGVSWRILLEDLQLAYSQLLAGERVQLAAKTTSFQHWAETLKDYSSSEAVLAEADYWLDASRRTASGLPRDYTDGDNSVGSTQAINVSLSREETQALLQEVPAVYHTQINDLLLTALALALSKWMGSGRVLIDMEGHGREQVSQRVDVSRTVGWFTSIYPVMLEVGDVGSSGKQVGREEEMGEVLKRVKEQLREVPEQGIGYGLLRYLRGDEELKEEMERMAQAEVSFNYLGQLDRVLGESRVFRVARESGGSQRSPKGKRQYVLEINSIITGGRLQLSWTYSQHVHRRESIEQVAAQYIKALQQIIHHCQSEGAGGYTPSDFPLARLRQAELNQVVGGRTGIEDLYRLSPMQQGMLFHSLYAPHSGLYFEQVLNRFEGEFDVEGLKYAWEQVIERHEVLRSSYQWEGVSWPVQIVHAEVAGQWMEEDWRELATAAQQERLEHYLRTDRERGFKLREAPLMRFRLLRTADAEWQLVWSFHHILLDGWCIPLLMKEVYRCYEAYIYKEVLELARPRPYRDYIGWLQGQDMREAEAYWRSRLAGFTSPTPLGIGALANSLHTSSSTYAEQQTHLSVEATSELEALARQQQVTLNTVVQGAWALLLSRYSQQQDVLFGATVSGRPPQLAGVEEMVGLFINSLPVRVLVREEARLGEWLQQLQAEQSEMRQYEYSPLVEVQGWSEVERGVALFESLLAYENYPVEPMVSASGRAKVGVRYRHLGAIERTNYPVTVVVVPGGKLLIKVLYEEERLEGEGIERLLGHIERLLESMTEGAGQRLSELRMLRGVEEEQLLVEWNRTESDYRRDVCAHHLFELQAARTPDAVALISEDEQLTYAELNRRSNQLAHYLHSLGVGPESLVGVFLERSAQMVTALLGIFKAGAAYLPIDPECPRQRLSFMLDDARVKLLLTQEHLLDSLPTMESTRTICLNADITIAEQYPDTSPVVQVSPDNLAYVIYTSGSTGKPKGVAVQHRSLVNLLSWHQLTFSISPADRATQLASLAFDAAVWELWPYLTAGSTIYLFNQPSAMTPEQLRDWLVQRQITICFMPTPLAETVLEIEWPTGTRLRLLLVGGDKLHRYEDRGLPFGVVNNYGPTECTVVATSTEVNEEELKRVEPSIGRPIWNTRVYVADASMQLVPVGVSGQLLLGGQGLARGYLNRPEMTAERFLPDPFSLNAGQRLYRTGDLCRYRPDGRLEYLGRIDQQVKVRGYRIELGEVEAAVSGHCGVKESVVVASEERAGEKRLVCYLVMKEGEVEVSTGELREHLAERLPEYMIPSQFVLMAQLPLNANGKVDRRALPSPEEMRGESKEQQYAGTRTPVEEILAGIWADVLGVEKVEMSDNFFELGGHSLIATQIITRACENFHLELPLSLLFESPTLGEFSSHVENMIGFEGAVLAPAIEPIGRDQPLPLSFAQQRLWFLHQLDPLSPAYNIITAIALNGSLDLSALQRSLAHLISRHESLRTIFPMHEGRAVQQIVAAGVWELEVEELSPEAESERGEQVSRRVSAEASEPFELERGPLVRVKLLRLSASEHVLVVVMHHIISDGWSLGVLRREVAELYEGYVGGEEVELEELRVQYADYAVWQRGWLRGEVLEQQLEYWKHQLRGAAPVLELPTDRPRPAVQDFLGATQSLVISQTLAASLKALSQSEGVTLFITLLAAFQLLLARYSRQDEIIVGSAIAGRNRSELEGLIGFFVNTFILRTDLSGNPSVVGLLGRVREVLLGAHAHQDVPFEQVVEELQPERNMSHQPLFQVMFSLQNAPREIYELPELTMSAVYFESRVAKFDLTLSMSETPKGPIYGVLEYSTALFDATTITRMLSHYERVLKGIVSDPHQGVLELPLVTEEEEQQIIVEWNRTATEYPRHLCIHQLFERQAALTPDAIAVIYRDERLTYSELNERSNQLAHYLRAQGVEEESLVGLCLERSPLMVTALLAILKAGGAYLPLDPAYPPSRLSFMLADAEVSVLLTQEHLLKSLPALLPSTALFCLEAEVAAISQFPVTAPVVELCSENLAYVIYTSGSTGTPKGVAVTHRGVVRLVHNTNYISIGPDDVLLHLAPLSFDASTFEVWGALLNGARLVVPVAGQLSLAEIGAAIESHQVSTLWLTAGLFHLMVAEQLEELAQVRQVLAGGDVLSAKDVRRVVESGGEGVLINGYGPTENTTFSCCHVMRRGGGEFRGGSVPIGRAVSNTRVYVVDEGMAVVPVGVSGELLVGGDGLARGYLHRAEMTAERFIPDPFSEGGGERLYRTGDVVRWGEGGELEFMGRQDEQVKVRGYRVETGEVEAVLLGHAAVRESVVLARAESGAGSGAEGGAENGGGKRLIGYVVLEEGEGVSAGELGEYLRERLPEFMVPGEIVELEEMPLSANGKVDRRALVEREEQRGVEGEGYVGPRTPVEEILSNIWAKLLGRERVGMHDNFFELGGDSIISIQAIARANQAGLQLSPKDLFQHQTIAGLASITGTGDIIEAEQSIIKGVVQLTPIQQWFFEQEIVDAHHFNQSLLLLVHNQIDPSILRDAAEHLLLHHDALRLRYQQTPDGWQQFHAPADEQISFTVIDLSTVASHQQPAAIEATAAETQSSLSLTDGPLMRFIYFNLGEERPARLLIVCHHLVIDGVSWRILLEDLQLACSKLAAAENPRLPTKTTSFQHWAETLKDYSSSEAVLAEADYWLDASRRTAFGLPRDYTDGDNSVGSTQAINVSLSAEETQALLQEVPAVYHTQISDVLLTALALALSKWMGSGRVLIDMEGHGREQVSPRVDVSRTVGWFTSIYPVLLEVGGQGGGVREEQVGEVLKRVKEQLREIPEQGIGYGLLRYMSGNQQVRAELERMPQAEVIFNYLGQVDRVLGESGAFGVAPEFGGSQRSSQGIREHLLEINSMVAAGRLQLSWTYSQHVHRRESIEEIAAQYIKALQQIIHHCQSEGAGGYTPSDFPLAQLMQAQLDRVMAERRGVEDLYRLSPMQQGMLFHSLYAPHSGLYFEQALNRFEGQFDVEGLKYAWEQVIERHEVLRSSYQWEGVSWPVQIVHAEVAGQWMEEDWRELATTAQQERLESFLIADRRSGFDLTRPPLMRLALLRLGDEVWEVVWSFHHILLDGWCMSLLMKEVFGYYEAYTRGEELEIARPRPYRDYIGWLQGQDMEEAEAYWRSRLAGFTSPTPLGIGAQANSLHTSSSTYAEQQTHLSVEATSELEALARQQQVTLNTVVQGAWALLLSRYSQEQDVLFGATVSGRPPQLAGVEEMVGLFINSLPVRVLVREEARLGEWLQQLQAEQSEMRQYEYSPLVEVQGWSEVERGVALFESLLAYENYPVEPMVAGASETVGRVRYEQVWSMERTNYPLTIVVGPGRRLLIKVLYEEERLEGEGIERLLGHIERLLESMTEGAGQRLSELRMMREEEEEQILVEWNRTATEYPRHLCIHQLFERQAALTPDATAVVYQDERLTYSELNGRSNQLAHYLRAQGVVEESLVGLCLERSALMVTALLGILKAGGAYLPLDPAYPPSRLSFMLHDAGASFLLTHHLAAEHLAAPLIQAISLERVRDQLSQHSTANLHQELCSENLAYVIYTSGSTGTPKGVAVTHRGVVRLVHNTNYISIGPDDVLLHLAPLSFDASTFEVWGALLNGARLVVPVAGQLSLAEIGAAIESHQVSTLWLTAGLFHLMVAEQLEELAQVRQVLAGGDVLSARDVRRVVESGGEGVLINGYGPTENTTFSCCHVMRRGGGEFRGGSVPIGRAVSNTRVYVVDEGMAVVPVGVSGELLVGGDGLARGYLHRAEMTAERFIPDPFSEGGGERLYRTGDVVRWGEGGELEFMGRQDEQVKVRGYRVETGEVEAVLQSHAAVRESVVIAQAEGGAGSGAESGAESGAGSGGESGGGKRLIGYVVLEEGLEVSVGELGEYLRERLPEFMVPGEIVELEEMPLSANGKVDRRALVERAAQRGVEGEGYVGPRTPVEEILSNIWAEVLGVKRVGIHDNFFELGGHSLKATQIVSRVRDIFKVHLPLRRLFEEALTVAELAELTEEAKDQIVEAQEPSIVPISRDAYRTNRSSLRIDNNSYGD